MSPRTSRLPKKNPKSLSIRVRIDEKTRDDLEYCANELGTDISGVVRLGIKKIKLSIQRRKKREEKGGHTDGQEQK